MSKNVDHIIEGIDLFLETNDIVFTNPVEVSKYLDRKGLLKDSIHRPGKPLRDLLRKGLIRHAFQEGRKWIIPKSQPLIFFPRVRWGAEKRTLKIFLAGGLRRPQGP